MPMPRLPLSVLILAMVGCVSIPRGPSMMVLPGQNKPFDVFRAEEIDCQSYAYRAIGASPSESAQRTAVDSAVVGTVVGAAAGALLGSASGDAGAGAAIGAGSGLIVGSAAGSGAYGQSALTMQDRFDAAYLQCMYAKGNQIPVTAGFQQIPSPAAYPPPNTPPPTHLSPNPSAPPPPRPAP
jgi:Glycine-zipper domain